MPHTAENPAAGHEPRTGGVTRCHDLRIFGLTEPQVRELLADLLCDTGTLLLTPCALTGEVSLHLSARAADEAACEARMAPLLRELRQRLGSWCYESCTGGLVAKRLTDVSGASQVFLGGVVSYTNGVKQHALGVPPSLLETYGAVSAPVARAMATGVRVLTGSDLAVAVTGVAGPDRDDRGHEIGTMFVAIATPEGSHVRALNLGNRPMRQRQRTHTAHHAFDLARRYLAGLPYENH